MLQITIPAEESWDEERELFVTTRKEQTLQLEHSLVSISKWESKWQKPFLTKKEKTREETLYYIKCMTITQNVSPETFEYIPSYIIDKITEYINNPMTATTFSNRNRGGSSRETVTSEVIYYWMTSLGIPFSCEKWHLNRLLTLIHVCNVKNGPQKKMSKMDTARQYAALNASRRQQLNSRG